MIPHKVYFTGLEFEPHKTENRRHLGVIPLEWTKYRFKTPRTSPSPIGNINTWLKNNIEKRWSIWIKVINYKECEIQLAFESKNDAVIFVLSDGPIECIKNSKI